MPWDCISFVIRTLSFVFHTHMKEAVKRTLMWHIKSRLSGFEKSGGFPVFTQEKGGNVMKRSVWANVSNALEASSSSRFHNWKPHPIYLGAFATPTLNKEGGIGRCFVTLHPKREIAMWKLFQRPTSWQNFAILDTGPSQNLKAKRGLKLRSQDSKCIGTP